MRLDMAGLRATFTPSSIDFSILFNCFSMNTYNFYDWREKTITTSGGKSGEKDVGGKILKPQMRLSSTFILQMSGLKPREVPLFL